ncbi:MAG: hypothetical protein MJD61_17725, partial [Proteobacteria bacterium]|nr:hypothetical protein [Pseudomonadota bacterium]
YTLAIGAQNLLNTFPERNPDALTFGSLYPENAPSGLNGGLRVSPPGREAVEPELRLRPCAARPGAAPETRGIRRYPAGRTEQLARLLLQALPAPLVDTSTQPSH